MSWLGEKIARREQADQFALSIDDKQMRIRRGLEM